jgi:plasmid replication initiation protein
MSGEIAPQRVSKAKAPKALKASPQNQVVTMSNALIRAGHGLSLSEKRIVAASIAKLDSRVSLGSQGVPFSRLTAAEYADTFGVDLDTAYRQLRDAAKNLYARSITFYEPAHKRGGKAVEPTLVQMRWVGSVKYHKGEGWVELHWWPALVGHLTGLKKQFTTYQLQQASALRSQYSWKLLELLMRFKSTGVAIYSIEDFCVSVGATANQASDFGKIRTKIIEPAVKELMVKDGWNIEWEAIKRGRKVIQLKFEFKPQTQGDLFAS